MRKSRPTKADIIHILEPLRHGGARLRSVQLRLQRAALMYLADALSSGSKKHALDAACVILELRALSNSRESVRHRVAKHKAERKRKLAAVAANPNMMDELKKYLSEREAAVASATKAAPAAS